MDIKIKIVPNPLYGRPGSLVESPYIAQVIHTGTVTAADICEACKKENPQMTEPLASLATETIMDYGSDKVVTDVVRFNLGSAFFTMEPAVTGSVPTVDAPLSDENERYIKVVNGQSLNARIAALRPVIVNDDLGDVQFRSIETVEGEECFRNEIHGSGEFVALGKRLGGPDQKLQLFSKDGTLLSEATYVDSDLLGQRFTYKLATPPANDVIGNLVLSSTGKDTPERNPKTISHEVKYLTVGPTIDDIASEGHEGEIVSGTAFAAKGSGLDAFDAEAGDTVKVKWTQGGVDKEALIDPADIAADKLAFEFPDALVGVPMDTELTFEITFGETLKTKGSKLVEE